MTEQALSDRERKKSNVLAMRHRRQEKTTEYKTAAVRMSRVDLEWKGKRERQANAIGGGDGRQSFRA